MRPEWSGLIVLNYRVNRDYVMKLMTSITDIADIGRKIHISPFYIITRAYGSFHKWLPIFIIAMSSE